MTMSIQITDYTDRFEPNEDEAFLGHAPLEDIASQITRALPHSELPHSELPVIIYEVGGHSPNSSGTIISNFSLVIKCNA